MNSFLDVSQPFMEWLWKASWQTSWLVVLVLALQWAWRERLAARWRYALWLLVVLRLALPISWQSQWSVFNWVHAQRVQMAMPTRLPYANPPPDAPAALAPTRQPHTADNGVPETTHPLVPPASPAPAAQTRPSPNELASIPAAPIPTYKAPANPVLPAKQPPPSPAPRKPSYSWPRILFLAWLAGALCLAGRLFWECLGLALAVRQARRVDDPALLAVLAECRSRMGVPAPDAVWTTDYLGSPALYGLWRTQLLVPATFVGQFTPEEWRHIFLHELAHQKRRDPLMNWILAGLQVLHWFNPLVWLGFHRMRADRELACDALVLARAGEAHAKAYGRTILKVMENLAITTPLPGLVGLLEDKSLVTRRIRMIARYQPGSRWSWAFGALLALLAVACLSDAVTHPTGAAESATLAPSMPIAEEAANTVTPTVPEVRMETPTTALTEDSNIVYLTACVMDATSAKGVADARVKVTLEFDRAPDRVLPLKSDAAGICKIPLPEPVRAIKRITLDPSHTNYTHVSPVSPTLERLDDGDPSLDNSATWFPRKINLVMRHWEENASYFEVQVVQFGTSNRLANARVRATIVGAKSILRELELVTDTNGLCRVLVPDIGNRVQSIQLDFAHPNYAPKSASFELAPKNRAAFQIPLWERTTLWLAPEATIGGTVLDDRNRPVANAQVYLLDVATPYQSHSSYAYAYSESTPFSRSREDLGKRPNPVATSDAEGRWRFTHFPVDATWAQLEVVRPDGARETFATQTPDEEDDVFANWSPRHPSGPLELAALRDNKAITTLSPGVNVSGQVLDAKGKPVAGAIIREGRANSVSAECLGTYRADSQGRFRLAHRPPGEIVLTASADGWGCASQTTPLKTNAVSVVLQLPELKPLRARVVDMEDSPISGATVSAQVSSNHILRWTGKTDANGRVTWSNAPLPEAVYLITAPGRRPLNAVLTPSDPEQTLSLGKTNFTKHMSWIRVLDAATLQPIERFNVCGGTNVLMRGTHGRIYFPREEVPLSHLTAEGYEAAPAFGPAANNDTFYRVLMHKLPSNLPLQGLVYSPDNQPLADVKIQVQTFWGNQVAFSTAFPDGSESHSSDARGGYSIPFTGNDMTIGFRHEQGCYLTTAENLRKNPVVRLRSWGRLAGQYFIGQEVAKNQRLRLDVFRHSQPFPGRFNAQTQTDGEGRFHVDQIPPGEYVLHRMPDAKGRTPYWFYAPDLYPLHLKIEPGKTTSVTYGGGGRTVTGQITSEPARQRIAWNDDLQLLELKLDLPMGVEYEYPNGVFFMSPEKPWASTPEQAAYARARRAYNLTVDKTGAYTAKDIPPGTYWLKIRLSSSRRFSDFKPLAFLRREVVIPPAEPGHENDPVDLGTIRVPVPPTP
jgi:beta-lactamase regulating signal transducer with metallopeptidase domain